MLLAQRIGRPCLRLVNRFDRADAMRAGKRRGPESKKALTDGSRERVCAQAIDNECAEMAQTPAGSRNDQLYKSSAAIGNLVAAAGYSDQEAMLLLQNAALQAGCDETSKDLDTIKRGIEAGKEKPRGAPEPARSQPALVARRGPGPKAARSIPDFKPFPVDALPFPLREFVIETAESMNCDNASVALPVLAMAASVIGNTRTIELKKKWTEPSILWPVLVSDSGTKKSAVFKAVFAHLEKRQADFLDEYKRQMDLYEEQMKKASKEDGGINPTEPERRRVIVGDTTIEGMVMILASNPRGTLLFRDELDGFFGSFTRYKGGSGANDSPIWMEFSHGGCVNYDRKTSNQSVHIPRASVSITGAIQPKILRMSSNAGDVRKRHGRAALAFDA